MNRSLKTVVVLALTLALCNCATRYAAGPGVATPPQAARVTDDPALVQRYVERLPIGSTVKVHLVSGERFTAVLMVVESSAVVVKPKTRVPVPARTIPLNTIVRIEPTGSGGNTTRSVLIGVGAGAAAFFGILLWIVAHSN